MTYSRGSRTIAVQAHQPGPDPLWRGLYQAGGICALLRILLVVILPAAMTGPKSDDL